MPRPTSRASRRAFARQALARAAALAATSIHGGTLLGVPEVEPCRVFTYARPAGL